MVRSWTGRGPEYTIAWGGRDWTLKVDGDRPGLATSGRGPVLALEGIAGRGRVAGDALTGSTLIGSERRHERIEATYAPAGWGDLTVRAAWSPVGDDGIDFEVQVQARSVGELEAIEVRIASVWGPAEGKGAGLRWVEPRDARSAALSYDGREADLSGLTTLPPREESFLVPRLIETEDGWLYAEMVHPDDVSRRIREGGPSLAQARTTRYGVFGHDLERGVVLRARLRAFWLPASETAKQTALESMDAFLREPPPLTT